MARGFGGGRIGTISNSSTSSRNSSRRSSVNNYNHRNSSDSDGSNGEDISVFAVGILFAVIILPIVLLLIDMTSQSLFGPSSTKWRKPLVHENNAANLAECENDQYLKYFYDKTGIVANFVSLKLTYSDNVPEEYLQVSNDLFYDGGHSFYKTTTHPTSPSFMWHEYADYEMKQLCASIYNYLYEDEYHILVIVTTNFDSWDFLYYTGEEADTVFDAQAGNIFTNLLENDSSYNTNTALTKTADIIMGPPFVVIIPVIIAIIFLICIFSSIRTHQKKKK